MFLKVKLTIIAAVIIANADTIISFKENTVAKASEVNSNFALIMGKLDSLKTMAAYLKTADEKIAALEKKCDSTSTVISSLQSALSRIDNVAKICDTFELKTKEIKDSLKQIGLLKSRYDTLDTKVNAITTNVNKNKTSVLALSDTLSVCRNTIKSTTDSLAASDRRNYLPTGTIIASMYAPDNNGYLKNPDGSIDNSWEIAAGQREGIPDLRGVFIRGIDFIAAGKPLTGRDETANRSAGSYQEDMYKQHNHNPQPNDYGLIRFSKSGESVTATSRGDDAGAGSEPDIANKPLSIPSNGGSETRPENVAVYYYIKVK